MLNKYPKKISGNTIGTAMTTMDDQQKKRIEREQGDVNTTPNREKYWSRNLKGEARQIFEDDKTYFMQQALSTPVLNVLSSARGAHIIDMQGRSYLDMHGNGVHNAGFNNPEVLKAVIEQLESGLTFCPRRYTNQPAVALAKKLADITPDGLCKSLFCPASNASVKNSMCSSFSTKSSKGLAAPGKCLPVSIF